MSKPRSIEEELYLGRVRQLAAGKVVSEMLAMVLDLDLFDRLAGKSVTLAELQSLLDLPAYSARMLAQFLCREKLLVYADGRLSNHPAAEAFLTGEGQDRRSVRKLARMAVPAEALRERLKNPPVHHWYQLRDEGGIVDGSSMIGQQQESWLANFLANNHEARVQWGEELAARYDFSSHRRLLDVGGGSGGWCIGIRKTNPRLECRIFDLPEVRELAEKGIAEAGEEEHIRFVEGSFFADDLPEGADVALLANILHNWQPDDDRVILAKAFQALPPGGTLLVKEYFFEEDFSGPVDAVFSAFIVLGKDGKGGWQPTYGEAEDLLREAGFTDLERRFDLVIARKPA
ncbi:MAG TPA: methyltransferase [Thermoanaerobaculia bacterium]|nr:methyltransferase [Thermoanaerobaculia bacterium]